ncbi:MAG: carbohydrate ABC transporter permease [Halothermotrichaceae bacterium]
MNKMSSIQKFFFSLAIILILVIVLAPYMWMISSSFKRDLEIQSSDPSWIPKEFTLENYVKMNKVVSIARYFKNSVIISSGSMVLAITLSLLAAYGISRFSFKGREFYSLLLFSTQMLPGVMFLIPYFLIFNYVKKITGFPMVDTHHGLILTYTQFALPFSILMLRNYLDSVPTEIDEQAMIDGCSRVGALFRVIIPLAKPGIAAVGIYAFIMGWNEILFAQSLTSNRTATIALGLLKYLTRDSSAWGSMMAACFVSSIPIIFLFTVFQKHIVKGLVSGYGK